MSAKGEAKSAVCAEITGNMVKIEPCKNTGLEVWFDKEPTQVLTA